MITGRALWAIACMLGAAACNSSTVESARHPLAGGRYAATLQNGVALTFAVSETRDARLTGNGTLSAATAGVTFSVSGTVRGDSVHLSMVRTTGETASLEGAFTSWNHLFMIASFSGFGGYTETGVRLTRAEVQQEF